LLNLLVEAALESVDSSPPLFNVSAMPQMRSF